MKNDFFYTNECIGSHFGANSTHVAVGSSSRYYIRYKNLLLEFNRCFLDRQSGLVAFDICVETGYIFGRR